jgi:O-succinylbenzoic acid--CoA ligase
MRSYAQNADIWEQNIINTVLSWYDNNININIYTSGTTNKPKLISINKESIIKSVYMTANYFNLSSNISALLCISPSYIGGKMMIFRAIILKWKLFCIKPNSIPLKNIKIKFDFAAMVPLQVYNSIFYIDNKINILLIGGSPISVELENMILKHVIKSYCYLSFGMTETLGHIAIRSLNKEFKSQYFIALNNVYLSINSNKCLIINMPYISNNYIITNDIVKLKKHVKNYYFIWLGRYDNIINSSGIKVIPEQLEHFLSFYIKRIFFIHGVPDDRLGLKVYLFVEGNSINLSFPKIEIIKKLKLYKNIIFIKGFVRTKTGKINRIKTLQSINLIN